jgi:hypothetical protein
MRPLPSPLTAAGWDIVVEDPSVGSGRGTPEDSPRYSEPTIAALPAAKAEGAKVAG